MYLPNGDDTQSESRSCDNQKPKTKLNEQQQNLKPLWNHPGLATWMTQPSPHSQDSELTINYDAEPLLNRKVHVFRHCLHVGFFPWSGRFFCHTTLHFLFSHWPPALRFFVLGVDAYPLLDSTSAFDDKLQLFIPLFGFFYFFSVQILLVPSLSFDQPFSLAIK